MEPMVLEYSLLANLLLLGMWPKQQNDEYTQISLEDSHTEYETMETLPLLFQYRSTRSGIKFSVIYALTGIIVLCPVIVFRILQIYVEFERSFGVLAGYSFSNTVLICLTIKCLHLLSIECRHGSKSISHSSGHFFLLFGSSGYMFFVTLSLFNDIHRNDNVESSTQVLFIYMDLSFILCCFLQCILILQADKCVKFNRTDKLFFISVENLCLMLGFIHLGSWIDGSFLSESHSMPGVGLVEKAKNMHAEIQSYLENYTERYNLPRANDVHLIPFLEPSVESSYSENQIDELVNFLCSKYPSLQDISSRDISSLKHNIVQFIVNYRQGGNILVNAINIIDS
ncbi:Hypothetical predicted protein [Mytilus galloprovincialis]|uniref:Uncharacterized protein n=1 Tax=Mytilus galloprovincialis TaxID=29158 RepID=A0A8B6DH45_MYTGA|nr:Hypothetical predicted protein [Mytilus galloprovincialis]